MPNFFDNLKAKSLQPQQEASQEDTNSQYFESIKQAPEYQKNPEPLPQESRIGSTVRNLARTGARVLETGAGMAGDVIRPAQDLLENFISKTITGKPITPEQKEKIKKFYSKSEEMQPFPTSSEIKESHEPITKEYLKPKNETEAIADEVTQDIVPYMLGGGKGFINSLVRAGSIAGLGQAGKEIARQTGAGEKGQDFAKMGTMFLSSMFDPKKATKLASSLYSAREASIPVGVTANATKLESNMLKMANKMRRSGRNMAPSEKEIAKAAEGIVADIRDGQMSYQKAAAHKRSLHETAKKFLYENPTSADKAGTRKLFSALTHDLESFIETSKDKYPKFYNAHKQANEVFGAIESGRKASRFLEENLPKNLGKAASKVASAILKPIELTTHFVKSPTLRKYYLQAIHAAANENAPQMIRNIRKLQEGAEMDPEIAELLK